MTSWGRSSVGGIVRAAGVLEELELTGMGQKP
jgi:hypothetical protein